MSTTNPADHFGRDGLSGASSDDLQRYFHEFVNDISTRLDALEQRVEGDANYATWVADRSPASLFKLSEWFFKHITKRLRSAQEIARWKDERKIPAPISDWDLSDDSLLLVRDLGMYFAVVIQTQHPRIRWHQFLNDRRNADFGHAVLVGFRGATLNPLRIVKNFAHDLLAGRCGPDRLPQLYEFWSELVDSDV